MNKALLLALNEHIYKNAVEEPRISFLNQLNVIDLLLHECGQSVIFLHHELCKGILCFSEHKFLNRHIAEDAKVLQIQPVERQRSKPLLHGAIRVVETGIIFCSAKDGITVGAERSWKYLKAAGVPAMFYISKIDEEHGDYYAVLSALKEK